MAESNTAAAPALSTNIESGHFEEKTHHHSSTEATTEKKVEGGEEDEDEDIDALIEDLESVDGGAEEEEEEEESSPHTGRVVPEELLQTDSRIGLTSDEGEFPPQSIVPAIRHAFNC